ncbi:MAG: PAS domain S-box protein [Gemmatimonadales bacterium]|nr:PAS domain S-box protein [Gemmatimonadales bacterium]
MPADRLILVAAAGTQAGLALVFGVLLLAFERSYRRPYLRWWALGWLALAGYLTLGTLTVAQAFALPTSAPVRLGLTYIAQVLGSLHLGLLAFGLWESGEQRPVTRRVRLGMAAVALGLAVVTTGAFSADPAAVWPRYAMRVGLHALLACAVQAGFALYLFRRHRHRPGLGGRLLAGALLLGGAVEAVYFYHALALAGGWPSVPSIGVVGFAEVVVLVVVGLAMVGWLLEEERARVVAAGREAEAAAQELARKERYFRALIENTSDVISVLTLDATIAYESPSIARNFGYTAEECIGRSAFDYIHPDDAPRVAEEFAAGLADPATARQTSLRFRHKAGHWLLIEASGRVLLDADGRPGQVVVVSRDITAAQRADEAHRRSEALLSLHVARTPLGVIEFDAEGRVRQWNPAAERIFGWGREEAIGRHAAFLVPEERQAALAADWQEVLANRRPDGWRSSSVNLRRDGQPLDCEWFSASLLNASGEVVGVAAFVQDMTEQRRLERHVAQSQRVESIGRLAGGVAHDFNNLLTAIFGGVAAARDALPPGHAALAELEDIQAAADRAAGLTHRLLAFARQQVVQPTVFDLNELTASLAQMLRRLIGENIEFVTVLGAQPAPVLAERGQLEQVLVNLVVNARDAMPEGGRVVVETARLTLRAPALFEGERVGAGEYVTLTVRDTGVGVPESIRPHLFEPFFTTKAPGHGTGLGLATCHGIVHQHRGCIWCASSPGQGAAFTICLPLDTGIPLPAPGPAPAARTAAGHETILLVEDEPAVRTIGVRILRSAGYQVIEAADGEEAWSLLSRGDPEVQLVVTDLVMPRLGGLQLADRLSASRPQLPIVFTSGYSADLDRLGEGDARARPFLRKPFTPAQLRGIVQATLTALPAGAD